MHQITFCLLKSVATVLSKVKDRSRLLDVLSRIIRLQDDKADSNYFNPAT